MAEEYRHLNQRRLHRQGRQTQQGLQLVADAPLTLGVAIEPGIGLLANHVERDLLRVIVTLIETRVEQRRGLARQIFERRSAAIGSRDQSGHRYVFKPEQIGRAHVCTPVTNAHIVCRLLLENNNKSTQDTKLSTPKIY